MAGAAATGAAIGSVVPGVGTIAGGLIGGAVDLFGGILGNSSAAKQAQKDRDFQERMSNTAYQRQVTDLKAAGLNPMLGYMHGDGASTPGGAVAQQSNPASGVAHSAQAVAETMLTKAQLANVQADTQAKVSNADVNAASAENIRAQMGPQVQHLMSSAGQLDATTKNLGAQYQEIFKRMELVIQQTQATQDENQRSALLAPLVRQKEALENQAKSLGMPALQNESNSQQTWFKKNISPYLKDVGAMFNVAGSAGGAFLGARSGR